MATEAGIVFGLLCLAAMIALCIAVDLWIFVYSKKAKTLDWALRQLAKEYHKEGKQ